MKILLLKHLFLLFLFLQLTNIMQAQQQSIIHLLVKSFNEAHQGFPSFINDTLPKYVWGNPVKPAIVKNYAGVKEIEIQIDRNFKSELMNNAVVPLYQMQISSETINKKWATDSVALTEYYDKIVNTCKQLFGSQLNMTAVIPLQDPKEVLYQPRFIIFFYEKKIKLPEGLMDAYDVQRKLDVAAWFSIELRERPLLENYHILFYVSGGVAQPAK